MFSKKKFYFGIAFLIQAVTFLAAFFAFRHKNKGLANVILAFAAAGAAAGAVMLYLDRKEELKWRKLVSDPDIFDGCDFDTLFDEENECHEDDPDCDTCESEE
ncbi:MAG: hypothetical protein IJY93_08190 [Clostridia bacterium]|nr:hypothetical protein [Clostridia bacterium]